MLTFSICLLQILQYLWLTVFGPITANSRVHYFLANTFYHKMPQLCQTSSALSGRLNQKYGDYAVICPFMREAEGEKASKEGRSTSIIGWPFPASSSSTSWHSPKAEVNEL